MKLSLIQLGFLIWKCWKTEGRNPIRLTAEIVVPVLMFVVLAAFRLSFDLVTNQSECHFGAKPMPSAGHVPFVQGLVCNYENECKENKTRGERGEYPFDPTLITGLVQDADIMNQRFAANPSDLLLDGTFLRIMRKLDSANKLFKGFFLPEEAKNYSTVLGTWSLLCAEKFPFMPDDEDSEGSSGGGGGNEQMSQMRQSFMESLNEGPNDECSVFLRQFRMLKPLWDQTEAVLIGKIVYYPDTVLTRKIMENANDLLDWESAIQRSLQLGIRLIKQAYENYNSTGFSTVRNRLVAAGISSSQATWLTDYINSAEYDQLINVDLVNFMRKIDCFRFRETSNSSSTQSGNVIVRPASQVRPRLQGFNSVDSMISSAMQYNEEGILLGAVQFKDPELLEGSQVPDVVKYSLRFDPSDLDDYRRVKSRPANRRVRRDPGAGEMKYFESGFIYLQDAVDKSIIYAKSPNSIFSSIGTIMQQFPFPCYMFDVFLNNLAGQTLLFVVLGWIFPAAMIVKTVVLEKEQKLREVARIMGISPGLHFLSWFIFWFFLLAISITLFVVLLTVSKIFVHTDSGTIFLVMLSYASAVIAFGFFLSAFFSKANIGAVVGGLAYFLTYIAFGGITNGNPDSLNLSRMMLASLMPNCALGFCMNIVGQYEMIQESAGGSNFNKPLSDEAQDQYTLAHGVAMLLIDTVLYYFIAWYIEHVFPGEYGVPKPFYFLFMPSFWCGGCCKSRNSDKKVSQMSGKPKGAFQFEDEPTHLPVGCSLNSLTKIYDLGLVEKLKLKCGKSTKAKKAVDNFSLNMFEGQITALLGHNGAGKTTAMSMMTGLISATSGSVNISGYDVETDLEEVRKVLGYCPQFNVLYDNLTVEEHLGFYAMIRGIEKSIIRKDIEKMLIDTNLTAKRGEPARVLSGGMRRRLSIAIAFIGNSKCIILDEPTAGVDPYARRGLWDLLSKFREGRTIILSTHHMDEAEVLADRIAVMSQGQLQTCGSPMFLKETCGDGYQLTVMKVDRGEHVTAVDRQWEDKVTEFIRRQGLSNYTVTENMNGELHIKLAYDNVPLFATLFSSLERSKNELNISEFGLSDATMEEIFIRMADMADKEEDDEDEDSPHQDKNVNSSTKTPIPEMPDYKPQTGFILTTTQFWALIIKRFHRMRRNIKGFVSELILPVIFVLLGVVIIRVTDLKTEDPPSVVVHPYHLAPKSTTTLDKSLYVFVSHYNQSTPVSEAFDKAVIRSEYLGTRCMDSSSYVIEDYSCNYQMGDSGWYPPSSRFRQRYCECRKDAVQKCEDTGPMDARNSHLRGYGDVKYRHLMTTDKVLDLSGLDVADYVVDQFTSIRRNFYGGISYMTYLARSATVRPSEFTYRLINPNAITVWFNNKGFLANIGYSNVANNILYKLVAGGNNSASATKLGIVTINQPLNYTQKQFNQEIIRRTIIDVMMAIMLILALSFIPASFVMFLIEDRVSDSKHVQIVSGLRPAIYWMGNYVWDCINFIIPAIICVVIFLAFNLEAYTNEKAVGPLILLFFLYGFAITPMLYPLSFLIDTPSTAFVLLASANLFIGAGTTVATWFLDFLGETDESIVDVNDLLKKIFLILPQYCLGRGLIEMAMNYRMAEGFAFMLGKDDFMDQVDPMDMDVCGKFYAALIVHIIFWILFILFIEYRKAIFSCCRCSSANGNSVASTPTDGDDDPDVAAERRNVMGDLGGPGSPYTMVVRNLKKVFRMKGGRCCARGKKLTAVNNVTFGVQHSQCFGLLGVNGAGKSTTFNMLTGRLEPSAGSASIQGFDIAKDRNNANKLIGYCPQYDCITPLLTGRENLEFFARLRGVPGKHVARIAEINVARLDLVKHVDKQSAAYSGGNKRKLSAAIALTGEPPLLFLDEPTAGIDPRARRFLWRAISNLLLNGQSVVLTTHSMDECEALCTRLTIMVNGQFRCIGSPQHLKARFGEGYLINLRFKPPEGGSRLAQHMTPEFDAARDAIKAKFGDVSLKEAHDNVAVYSVGASGKQPVNLGELFGMLTNQSTMSSLHVQEFSVMQSSLDAVFVTFAKMQASDVSDADRLAHERAAVNHAFHNNSVSETSAV